MLLCLLYLYVSLSYFQEILSCLLNMKIICPNISLFQSSLTISSLLKVKKVEQFATHLLFKISNCIL